LFDIPAPTVTFYTLLGMAGTVVIAFLVFAPSLPANPVSWWPLFAMALITFVSRLTLFTGIKHLGGLQTALIGLGELLITVILAVLWLGDRLTLMQWLGAALIAFNLLLVGFDKPTKTKRFGKGFLYWLTPSSISPTTDIPFQD
jgi:drug/metabolite transporter (DMT)-like permease